MEQITTEKAAETSQGEPKSSFRCISFRVSPEDENTIKIEAERRRTNVSSLIRGAMLQVGILKPELSA